MTPRNPKIDFSASPPHWAANREFAQIVNAGSTTLPYIEPYLNKVIQKAMPHVADAALRRDMTLFMAQEGNHYRQHKIFNRGLHGRYPGLKAFEDRLAADFDAMLSQRSLAWNAAYCEGFECLGIIHAAFIFEEIDDLIEGADPAVVDLWKWHLAEEFEHRTVCFDVQKALGGGYVSRLGGFLYALRHLGGYGKRVSTYLLECDRQTMSAAERRQSEESERRYNRRFARFARSRLLSVLSPGYNPRAKPEPRGAAEFLRRFDAAA